MLSISIISLAHPSQIYDPCRSHGPITTIVDPGGQKTSLVSLGLLAQIHSSLFAATALASSLLQSKPTAANLLSLAGTTISSPNSDTSSQTSNTLRSGTTLMPPYGHQPVLSLSINAAAASSTSTWAASSTSTSPLSRMPCVNLALILMSKGIT